MSVAKRRIGPAPARRSPPKPLPHPLDRRQSAVEVAAIASLAGVAVACAGIEIYAWLTGAPGLEVIFQ